MKQLLSLSTAVLCLLSFTGTTQAQSLVGVQFPQYYGAPVSPMNGGGGNGYTGGVVQQTDWNVANGFTNGGPGSNGPTLTNSNLLTNTYGNSANTPGVIVDSTGAATGLTFALTNAAYGDHGNNGGSFPSPVWYAPGGLTDAYIAQGSMASESTATPVSLAFTSGIDDSHTYNLYIYTSALWYYGAVNEAVNLGSTTYYILNPSSSLSGWVQSTATSAGAATTGDYVEFTNVSGSVLDGGIVTMTGSGSGLGGFQLQDLGGATPEPSAMMLIGVGLVGLVFFVRRNRLANA